MGRRRQVRIAHAHVDDVGLGIARGRLGLVDFFFQAEDGIRDPCVTGVQTCALPISFSIHTVLPTGIPSPVKVLPYASGSSGSEERRVGKSVDLGGRRISEKKD